MKVFVWNRVDKCSDNWHSEGGVVAFAETEERARELANVGGCYIQLNEKPDDVRDVLCGPEKVYWMPDAGCC